MQGRRFWAEKDEWWLLPCAAFALAALTLFPLIGRYGLWDPQEITIADQARHIGQAGSWWEVYKQQPPLTMWLLAWSTKHLGTTEVAVRLPLALMGLVAALATYGLGARLRRPRAGLLAAMVILGSPLLVLQSRQLISDIGSITGGTVAMLGLAGLAWPRSGRYRELATVWKSLLALVGLAIGFLAAGIVIGVAIPLLAVAVTQAITIFGRWGDQEQRRWGGQIAFGGVVAVAALVAIAIPLREIFHLTAPEPGQAALLFGKTIKVTREYLPIVGGAWRVGDAGQPSSYDYIINQVAFGMFPWSALAPVAMLRVLQTGKKDRNAWGGMLLLIWALVAYVVCTLWSRKVGEVRFPAIAAIAVATGIFLDDVLRAKTEGDDDASAPNARGGLPLAAVFTAIAGFILALDCRWFPDELAGVHFPGRSVHVPPDLKLFSAVIVIGVAFAGAISAGLFLPADKPQQRNWAKWSLWGGAGIGWLFGVFLSVVFLPSLSQHFSYKNLFESYIEHRKGTEPLAVMGIPGSGPDYYARGPLSRIDTVPQMFDFLHQEQRAFVIAPQDRLCMVQQESFNRKQRYVVLDDQNARYTLFTNNLGDDEKDRNPLVEYFKDQPPAHFDRDLTASFEDTFDLLGVDMPTRVGKGSKFKMTLWLRVKKRPAQNYKVFVHFDGPGVRFQGDHDPVGGKCGTSMFMPDEIIADTFEVTAGEMTTPKAPYTAWVGFFTGGGGIYHNMTVVTPNHDSNNRVSLGTLVVD